MVLDQGQDAHLHGKILYSAAAPIVGLRARALLDTRDPWSASYRWGIAAGDGVVVTTITVFAAVHLGAGPLAAVAGGLGVMFVFIVSLMHGYDTRRVATGPHDYGAILRAGWVWASVVVAGGYLSGALLPPRTVVATLLIALSAVLGIRMGEWQLVGRRRRRGQSLRRTLVVGDPKRLAHLLDAFDTQPAHGFNIVGICVPSGTSDPLPPRAVGEVWAAPGLIADLNIRAVVVAASCLSAAELRHFCWLVEPYHVELLIAPDIEDVAPVRVTLHPIAGTPLLTVAIGPSRVQRVYKSGLDCVLGSILLFAALPILAAGAVAVRLSSPGPALFRQVRIGRDSRPFQMVKLRTMYGDAEHRRGELLDHHNGNTVMFKMPQDPRITPVGRVLRRFSIDELPQLWNVVRGDMSLVGPRPPLLAETATYTFHDQQRLRVRPGMTGLWQVSGRADLDWGQTVALDLNYVDNWSVRMDLAILGRTFRAVFGGKGAY